MKILHVINNLGSGGAERMLINFFKELKKEDGYFEILLLIDNTISYKNIPPHIKITILSNSKKRISLKKAITLYRYIKNNSFDVVHSHLFPSQYYLSIIKLFLNKKIKLVTTEHNTTNSRRKFWLLKQIDKIVYTNYDKIIFISNGVKEQFNKDYPRLTKKGIIINNGIPLLDFFPSDKISPKKTNIIMVARFSGQKDHNTLVKAMSLLDNQFTLSLVGEGEDLDKIKALTKELKLEKRVHFLGFRNDIAKLYRNHDIFVLSSNWEGFGLVAAEAMASGLPVIASNVNGLREVVQDTGLLFEQKNEKELAKLINKIATDETLSKKLITRGLETAKKYDIKKLVNTTISLYKNI